MPSFNLKLQSKHRKGTYESYIGKKIGQSIETITEEAQTLDLSNQGFTIQGFVSWFLFSVFNTLPNM